MGALLDCGGFGYNRRVGRNRRVLVSVERENWNLFSVGQKSLLPFAFACCLCRAAEKGSALL